MYQDTTAAGERVCAAAMKLSVILFACILAATVSAAAQEPASSSSAQSAAAATSQGLQVLNAYRAMAKLAALKDAPALGAGDSAHALYLVKNYGQQIRENQNLGVNFHLEDTRRPFYTYAGFVAGRSSDVIIWEGTANGQAAARAIDGWVEAPFHRFPLLSTHLTEVGYGEYCEAGACAAALNITSGSASPSLAYRRRLVAGGGLTSEAYDATAFDKPIAFPPDGSIIRLRKFDGNEWPDPLTSCPGYRPPTGLPITIQIGSFVKTDLSDVSVAVNGAAVPSCGIDSSNYTNPDFRTQGFGRDGLAEFGAVIIIPRAPLPLGSTCEVSATVNGERHHWSFAVVKADDSSR